MPGKLLSQDGIGSDWFEGALVQVDKVLNDFIWAITPPAANTQIKPKWLLKLDGVARITQVGRAVS